MTWKDLQARARSLFGGSHPGGSKRPDGGTSCYRPMQRRNRQEEQLAREKAAEYAAEQPPVAYAHTGFTGMNPPSTGSMSAQGAYGGNAYGYGGIQAGGQDSWAGYNGYSAQGQNDYSGYAPQAAGWGQGAPNNISYMPGVAMPDAGSSYTHVEHIMAITSMQSCYDAIECMKNGETLIVTLDTLGSEGESMRCQDMLAGAAFTLRCSVRNLASLGVVVIAPEGVKILPEQQARRYETPEMYSPQVQPWPAEEYTPRRERRVSQNPIGWDNAAQYSGTGLNPYTGSMPAAAGAYSAYGGY